MTPRLSGEPLTPTQPATGRRAGFRPDVEGLRALALGLVLLYNAGVPGSGGGRMGVDVFFVISGFLITGLLVRELEQRQRIDLARFYARRARRILPSAVAVTISALVLTALVAPQALRRVGGDALAATLQVANWRVITADFAGQGPIEAGSPLLHYWSLAVEEQFYLIWPLLVVAAAAVARRRGASVRPALTIVAATLLVVSLLASVVLTPLFETAAYLGTPTRAWQLAAGALLALTGPALARASTRSSWPRAAALVSALGLVVIVTGAYWTGAVQYPGWAATVPTAATAALIAAGAGAAGPVQRLLAWAPVQTMGRLSYVWYLWHVPVVYAAEQLGVRDWPTLLALEVVAAGTLAWVTALLVERPLRFSARFASTGRGLLLGAAVTAVGVGASAVAMAFG